MTKRVHAGRRKARRWWTVLLLYPDYLTDDYGSDTYLAWVRTVTPEEAVPSAQRRAVAAQRDCSTGATVDVAPDDFKMVAVWRGRTTLAMDAYSMA